MYSCFQEVLALQNSSWRQNRESTYCYLKHKCIHFFLQSLTRNFSVTVRFQQEIKESQSFFPCQCIFLNILVIFLAFLCSRLFRFSFSDSFIDYLREENVLCVRGSGEGLTKSRISCFANIKGHRIVYYKLHTMFVKSWRIFRHLLCSLPDGVRLYKASYHIHGDFWRLCTNSLILENLLQIQFLKSPHSIHYGHVTLTPPHF